MLAVRIVVFSKLAEVSHADKESFISRASAATPHVTVHPVIFWRCLSFNSAIPSERAFVVSVSMGTLLLDFERAISPSSLEGHRPRPEVSRWRLVLP